jgi:hypothetical protein
MPLNVRRVPRFRILHSEYHIHHSVLPNNTEKIKKKGKGRERERERGRVREGRDGWGGPQSPFYRGFLSSTANIHHGVLPNNTEKVNPGKRGRKREGERREGRQSPFFFPFFFDRPLRQTDALSLYVLYTRSLPLFSAIPLSIYLSLSLSLSEAL